MSKSEKPAKTSTTLQLKKELNQAGKACQGLADLIEKHANILSDAEAALAKDRSLRDEILSLQGKITALREENEKIANERREEIASWANVSLKLTEEYNERLRENESAYQSKLKDRQKQEDDKEIKWKQMVESENAETRRWKQAESHGKQQIANELQKAEESRQKKEEQFRTTLQKCKDQIVELSEGNKALAQKLTAHQTILRGRDTEMQMLGGRLAALEAFPSQEVTEKVADVITAVQTSLRDFCHWCLESAETFPGWHKFPNGIRNEDLPRHYSSDSASGRYVFAAAIQSSICAAMKQHLLPPSGAYANRRFWDVSEALFRRNESHEAVWRLMTVTTILTDQQIFDGYEKHLREVASSLLSSWNPFPGEGQEKETLKRLTRLLIDSAKTFLELQKTRRRIHVSIDVVSEYFDSDSEEDSHNVPGGFELPDSTAPVLCLFPAFFWTTSPTTTLSPSLLRKGTAMFRDSPPLLAALNDEREVRSPTMSNRKRLGT